MVDSTNSACLKHAAIHVLCSGEPANKVRAANTMFAKWRKGEFDYAFNREITPPETPNRPEKPKLVAPKNVKRRRLGSAQGRTALLHAIAHIEFNAIDLAADMVARFAWDERIAAPERAQFIDDWVTVCADEARHFELIKTRLQDYDADYGDLDAHNGLWEAAISTNKDLAARLAIAPMVLEARGLDVTPSMIEKLTAVGDIKSAEILKIIYQEEIPHVQAGVRWFSYICERENRDGKTYFTNLLAKHYSGVLKPPFNEKARTLAGIPAKFYLEGASQISI